MITSFMIINWVHRSVGEFSLHREAVRKNSIACLSADWVVKVRNLVCMWEYSMR